MSTPILQILAIVTDPIFLAGIFFSALLLHKFFHKRQRLLVLLLFLLLVVGAASIETFILKRLFRVERPCMGLENCPEDFSFPSGHSLVSFAFFSFLFFLNGRWSRSETLLAFPFLIALARVFQGVHTVADVTAGAGLGVLTGLGFFAIHVKMHKFEESAFRGKWKFSFRKK